MSTTLIKVERSGLEAERRQILERLDLSADEVAERAAAYIITAEESEAWERLRQISFLLGER